MFPRHTLSVIFSLIMMLTGCGQKGKLYMPSQKPPQKAVGLQQKNKQSSEKQPSQAEENRLQEQDAEMP